MLSVTVELGATLPLPDHGFIKPVIRIEGIDPSVEVEPQVRMGLEAGQKALLMIDDQLEVALSEIIATDGSPGYREKVEVMGTQVTALLDRVSKLTDVIEKTTGEKIREKVGGEKKSSR